MQGTTVPYKPQISQNYISYAKKNEFSCGNFITKTYLKCTLHGQTLKGKLSFME